MRFAPLILAALSLAACAADPAYTQYQASSRIAPDCGLAAKALRPMVVTIEFVDPENMPVAAKGANLQRAGAVHGFIQTVTLGNLRTHRITAPLPKTESDLYAWRVLFHEMRHANGEVHDARGCWVPTALPASPNEREASLPNTLPIN